MELISMNYNGNLHAACIFLNQKALSKWVFHMEYLPNSQTSIIIFKVPLDTAKKLKQIIGE